MNTFQNTETLYTVLIVSLIYIFYLNLKKNIFLGNSGSLFLGCLIGLNIILNYNLEISKIHYPAENIFIALMLPGIDMLRVFIIRISKKKNPFSPDRIHLHHLLLNKNFHLTKILVIFFILILSPIIVNIHTNISQLIIIFFNLFLYLILIIYLKRPFFSRNKII